MKSFRFLLLQKVRNFPAFVSRTRWFWCALLLVLLLPGVREQFLMLVNGPPVSYANTYSLGRDYSTFRPSSWEDGPPRGATPFDVEMLRLAEGYNDYEYYGGYGAQKTISRATVAALQKRFPQQKWLYAAALAQALSGNSLLQTQIKNRKDADARKNLALWLQYARRGALNEPNNALYPTSMALFEWYLGRKDAALQSLERAAKCRVYDDHNLEWSRAVLTAYAHIATLSWEERRGVWRQTRTPLSPVLSNFASQIAWKSATLHKNGQTKDALRWSGATARVGDLLQRGQTSPGQWELGRLWKKRAWGVALYPKKNWISRGTAAGFAAFAKRNGRADLARETLIHQARAAQLAKVLVGTEDLAYRGSKRPLISQKEDDWLNAGSIAAWMVMFHFAFVFCLWFVANFFLWRAIGEASSRRERLFPAALSVFTVCAGALVMAGIIWIWSHTPRGPARVWAREGVLAAICMLLFFSMPFWSAAFCAFSTARRERKTLSIPPRQALELRFSPFSMLVLERGALGVFVSTLGLTLILSLIWALANWFMWKPLNPLEWLAPDLLKRWGSDALFLDFYEGPLAIYGWWVVFCLVLAWFVRWRWLTPTEKRPTTHAGLRRWKEVLGAAFVLECWVFLAILVALWPLRATLHTRLDRVVQKGELVLVDAR